MKYPYITEIPQTRDMVTQFYGLDKTYGCDIAHFADMKNMTSENFPALSTRRHYLDTNKNMLTNVISIGDSIAYLESNMKLWVNTSVKYTFTSDKTRTLGTFGSKIVVMPDAVAIDYKTGEVTELSASRTSSLQSIGYADSKGNAITPKPSSYYDTNKPTDGSYMISTKNGATTIQQYSTATKSWNYISSTYISIFANNIGMTGNNILFKDGDSVRITVTLPDATTWDDVTSVFPNRIEGTYKYYTDAVIKKVGQHSITILGISSSAKEFTSAVPVTVERLVPELQYMVEYNNRLWGICDNEIRASKLGDITNWYNYEGLSTDSYAATIGTLGRITGSCVLGNNPLFFKEGSIIKVTVSGSGAHSYKEYSCAGVDDGSENSIAVSGNTAFYNSEDGIYAYGGSVPYKISDSLGNIHLINAHGAIINDKYFISGTWSFNGESGFLGTYCYDINKKIWSRYIDTSLKYMTLCRTSLGDSLVASKDRKLVFMIGPCPWDSLGGTTESDFDWYIESGDIGFDSPDKKYISRIDIRLQLSMGTDVSIYMNYDSSDVWTCVRNINSSGTKSFSVPIKPERCDHFRYKLVGHGDAKIISISKITEQGSDN